MIASCRLASSTNRGVNRSSLTYRGKRSGQRSRRRAGVLRGVRQAAGREGHREETFTNTMMQRGTSARKVGSAPLCDRRAGAPF